MARLTYDFFHRPCLEVARDLVGKVLVHNGQRLRISETEAYCGESDTACHAHKGRTKRTEVLYADAGTIYIYLCYGIHWLLNIITGSTGCPHPGLRGRSRPRKADQNPGHHRRAEPGKRGGFRSALD